MRVSVLVKMDADLKADMTKFVELAQLTQNDFIVKAIQLAIYGTGQEVSNKDLLIKESGAHAYTQSILRSLVRSLTQENPEIADKVFDQAQAASDGAKAHVEQSLG